ncbi:MAG: hypothetical protein KJ916_09585 [Alphaproteobacteria bacterium]|nr:hypothetical protein [Alphaproteobacteria bacterium]
MLSLFAVQLEPRFTMSANPGDRYVAEVFRFQDGVTTGSVDGLIGDAVRGFDRIEDLPEGRRVRTVTAVAASGDLIVVLAPAGDRADGLDSVCRISQRTEGAVDNSQRALSWCLSFVGGPTLTVDVPAPVLPR